MGLGKTIQMIAAIAFLKYHGILKQTVLLVVPSSLISNWKREIRRFAPTMSVTTYYGAGRQIRMEGKIRKWKTYAYNVNYLHRNIFKLLDNEMPNVSTLCELPQWPRE